MIEFLIEIDNTLFLTLHHFFRGPAIDTIMWWISDRWIWVPMYFVILVWLIRNLGIRSAIIVLIAIILATVCADRVCDGLIRPMVERMRPSHPENPLSESVVLVNDYRGGAYGFPSCHAANTVMLATFLTLLCRRWSLVLWIFSWAVLNCLSRIYLGVHYPGDILIGALVGAFFGWLWWFMARWVSGIGGREPIKVFKDKYRFDPVAIEGVLTLVLLVLIVFHNI